MRHRPNLYIEVFDKSGQYAKRVKAWGHQSFWKMIDKRAMVFLFVLLVGIAVTVGVIISLIG